MICLGPGCKNKLTGRQRKWCGDACRKQAMRVKKRPASQRKMSGFIRDKVGFTTTCSMVILVRATQKVPYLDTYSAINHLRMIEYRDRYAKALQQLMNEIVFGYEISVEVRVA